MKASDVVLNCADADSLPLTEAILSGLEQSQKKLPVLIHTRYAEEGVASAIRVFILVVGLWRSMLLFHISRMI